MLVYEWHSFKISFFNYVYFRMETWTSVVYVYILEVAFQKCYLNFCVACVYILDVDSVWAMKTKSEKWIKTSVRWKKWSNFTSKERRDRWLDCEVKVNIIKGLKAEHNTERKINFERYCKRYPIIIRPADKGSGIIPQIASMSWRRNTAYRQTDTDNTSKLKREK